MANTPSLKINDRLISDDMPPYIIAEISANHNGKLETAIKIIQEAKKAGADAVKLQTYTPDTITLKSTDDDFMIKGGLWNGRSLYDLYQEAHMPWAWHEDLFKCAKDNNITIFSSPFDSTAVDLLEDLNVPAYKIASFEAIDLPLIKYAASTKKPMIISTGMANDEEIEEAIDAAKSSGCSELCILHCVSAYPALPSDYNLKTILDMKKRFELVTGLSDHTLDNTTAISAVSIGASVIEKHFTLDRSGGGPDDSFSLEPFELNNLCKDSKTAWESLGKVDYGIKSSEKGNKQFRRSIYFIKDMKAGETVSNESIRIVRPGFGIKPKYFEQIIGQQMKVDVSKNKPVQFEHLKG